MTITYGPSAHLLGSQASFDELERRKGIKLGSATEAIFWASAKDGKYRVIYGDLSVRQVSKQELP